MSEDTKGSAAPPQIAVLVERYKGLLPPQLDKAWDQIYNASRIVEFYANHHDVLDRSFEGGRRNDAVVIRKAFALFAQVASRCDGEIRDTIRALQLDFQVDAIKRALATAMFERFGDYVATKRPYLDAPHCKVRLSRIEVEGTILRHHAQKWDPVTKSVVTSSLATEPHAWLSGNGTPAIWDEEHQFRKMSPITMLLGAHDRVGAESSVLRLTNHTLYERQLLRVIIMHFCIYE